MIKNNCRKSLVFWGYAATEQDPENPTAFFDNFEGSLTEEELQSHKGYLTER